MSESADDSAFTSVDDDTESEGYRGTMLLPATVRNSVGNVRGWMASAPTRWHTKEWKDAEKVLEYIATLPTCTPSFNPDVIVMYAYNDRNGSIERQYRTSLRNYLLLYAANVTIYYHDVVGKHSEVPVKPREFNVRWADGDLDDNVQVDEYKWRWNANERLDLSDAQRHHLANAVKRWTRSIGPTFTIDSPLPEADDFVPVYEAALRDFVKKSAKRSKHSDDV